MKLTFKLRETNAQIRAMLLDELLRQIKLIIPKAARDVNRNLSDIFVDAISSHPVYTSISDGLLKSDFGLSDGRNRIEAVIRVWANNFQIESTSVKKTTRGISGGFKIRAIDSSYNDVRELAESTLISSGGRVEWLKWLLFSGDSIVIKDYQVKYDLVGREFYASRTKKAIMIEGKDGYSIPPQYAGTQFNNFVTQTVDLLEYHIYLEMEKVIDGYL